jgi:hypothetical protein
MRKKAHWNLYGEVFYWSNIPILLILPYHISHKTKEGLRGNECSLASLGVSALKGKSEEIEIYKVL